MMDLPLPTNSFVVSCQAVADSPLRSPEIMAAVAMAAEQGGAAGIRANGPEDVHAIRAAVDVPIIGINKARGIPEPVYITPTMEACRVVADAGADMIALDGTDRARPGGVPLVEIIAFVHDVLELPVMADVDVVASARFAMESGADAIATTLSGYTDAAPISDGPDLDLVASLVALSEDCPVVAEGRFRTPDQVRRAFDLGAHAVVVGTAITNPSAITSRFTSVLP